MRAVCDDMEITVMQALAISQKIRPMDMARKTVRVDRRVADAFSQQCQDLGVIQERLVEALLVYGISLNHATVADLLTIAQEWKAGPQETEAEKARHAEQVTLEELDRARRAEKQRKSRRSKASKGNQDH